MVRGCAASGEGVGVRASFKIVKGFWCKGFEGKRGSLMAF